MKQIMINIVPVFATSLLLVGINSTTGRSQISPQSLEDGKRLYTVNCGNCHGETAQGAVKAGIEISIITERGGKQPPNLTDQAWDHGSTDDQVFTLIKKGFPSGMMPPFEGRLSDLEIQNVVSYVRSLASPKEASNAAVSTAAVSTGAVSAAADKTEPVKPTTERTLKLADYLEMPITGDMSADHVAGVLARGSIMLDEPGSRRAFLNDLTGPLYMLDKQTKQLTTYLNFNGTGDKGGLFPKFSATMGYAAGLMNVVFDPDYKKNGIFYTLHMENTANPQENVNPKTGIVSGLNLAGYKTTPAMAKPAAAGDSRFERELVIVEWTDRNIKNTTFEGTAREVFRRPMTVTRSPSRRSTSLERAFGLYRKKLTKSVAAKIQVCRAVVP
jgi:mono/diheme cytochrome c family protein